MTKAPTIVVDLDGTICSQEKSDSYEFASPNFDMIDKLEQYQLYGWRIVIYTARGMNTYDGDVAAIESAHRSKTESWLRKYNVPYDQLIFGKPAATYYIDDKGLSIAEFLRNDYMLVR
jgi:capsule biosynthesis phosphatase